MADPDSIFLKGLRKFQRKTAYANIVNDRSAVFYSTGISRIDPFADTDAVNVNYIRGYAPVIINPDNPVSMAAPKPGPSFWSKLQSLLYKLPKLVAMPFLVAAGFTIGLSIFLVNGFIQAMKSNHRVKLHETGKAGVSIGSYRIPMFVQSIQENVQSAVDDVFEDMNHLEHQDYLASGESEKAGTATPVIEQGGFKLPMMHAPIAADVYTKQKVPVEMTHSGFENPEAETSGGKSKSKSQKKRPAKPLRDDPTLGNGARKNTQNDTSNSKPAKVRRPELSTPGRMLSSSSLPTISSDFNADEFTPLKPKRPEFPILALAPYQFTIIENLDTVGFRKYPVYIHDDPHSHAAMICRNPKPTFHEGKLVISHWLDNEFDL